MSALIMALVAGLAVGSDGVERIPAETVQGLSLEGTYWDGTKEGGGTDESDTKKVWLTPGMYWKFSELFAQPVGGYCIWVDEGCGKCQLIFPNQGFKHLGIYKHESGCLIVCLAVPKIRCRPTTFYPSEEQILVILHRVKPVKQ